jgi:hypothetical protein
MREKDPEIELLPSGWWDETHSADNIGALLSRPPMILMPCKEFWPIGIENLPAWIIGMFGVVLKECRQSRDRLALQELTHVLWRLSRLEDHLLLAWKVNLKSNHSVRVIVQTEAENSPQRFVSTAVPSVDELFDFVDCSLLGSCFS